MDERYRTIVEGSPRGLILLDAGGRCVIANPAAFDVIGAAGDDVIGRELWNAPGWIGTPAQGIVKIGCVEASAGRTHRLEVEPTDGGGRGTIWLVLTPIVDSGGVTTQIVIECGLTNDAMHQAGVEAHVMETLAAVSQLASRVAHDVNSPLAGIRNSFLLVKDGIPTTHPHYGFVAAIDREITRLAAFTRRLHETFDIGPSINGRPAIRLVVAEAVKGLRPAEPPIPIDIHLGPTASLTASVPGEALRLVIRNAVQDVVDAAPSGSSVAIRTRVVDDNLVLSVTATPPVASPGPPNDVARRPPTASGLGLLRRFAESLGVKVESPDDGRSGVCLQVPLAPGGERP